MTDIVERLRQDATCTSHHDAADEIERLRAAESVALLDALRFHRERDMWRNENTKKQTACEQMGARITALEAERDRLREALHQLADGTWFDRASVRHAIHVALKETGHD